jgi:diaminopimelate epimerase
VACSLNGWTDRAVVVHLDGGDLETEWSEADGNVYLTGPAIEVFSGVVDV